jgi:dephospho-CoA kinase
MAQFVVGLRGGIGTGKSSVSNLFIEKGIIVADADLSARTVVEPGKPAYNAIVEHFGSGILQENTELDRAKLRARIFSNDDDRAFLERQTHKPIIEDLFQITTNAQSDYAILVLSTGLGKNPMMQRLLVVDAPIEKQIERVMLRDDNTKAQVESIINAQPSRDRRVAEADDLIINDGDITQLRVEVERLHQLYLDLSKQNRKDHG